MEQTKPTNPGKDLIQREITKRLDLHGRGIVVSATGTGKTKSVLDHIRLKYPLGSRIAWLTPTIQLRDIDTPEEFIEWGMENYLINTKFICYHSAHKIKNQTYDLVVMDEAHSITELRKEFFDNNIITENRVICLTATPPTGGEVSKLAIFRQLNLKIIIKVPLKLARDLNAVPNFKIYKIIISLSHRKDIPVTFEKPSRNFMTSEFDNYNYVTNKIEDAKTRLQNLEAIPEYRRPGNHQQNCQEQQKQIMLGYAKLKLVLASYKTKQEVVKRILAKLRRHPQLKTVVFCGSKKQADAIGDQVFYSGSTDEHMIAFREGKTDHLIVIDRINQGVNLPCNTGILAKIGAKDLTFIQQLGRILRKVTNDVNRLYVVVYKDTVEEKWFDNCTSQLKAHVISKELV